MNLLHVLLSFAALAMVGLLLLHKYSMPPSNAYLDAMHSDMFEVQYLLELIRVQNETIHTLEAHLVQRIHKQGVESSKEDEKLVQISDEISRLSQENEMHRQRAASCANSSLVQPVAVQQKCPLAGARGPREPLSGFEADCEARYGLELAETWGRNEQIWCQSRPGDAVQSQLKCYPYHQKHKKLDGRGADLFCEASNFVVDFSKVDGQIVKKGKPSKGSGYLRFGEGSLLSPCERTKQYQPRLFMPHHALQMRGFRSGAALPAGATVVETPTYLLARDEDCENSFHSTADFMNMFLVGRALGLPVQEQQVLLLDKYADGPYRELIEKAFSPAHPVLRHTHYKGPVLFRRLIFHLESPAGLIFPKVSRPDPLRCYRASLFDAYRRHVLQAFNLLDVQPPPIPSVTLSLRHRSAQKNVGRVMANEQQVVAALQRGNMMDLNVVDTGTMSYGEQLKLARRTNVLVGIHGAGLMLIMFAAEEAVLVEIHPSYRQDRHFRHAARMTGKIYMPMRSTQRETCVGSSDSVTVPIDEFQRTIDGALRIARNFDDGLSECGLVCPAGILALDGRLDPHYKNGERRGSPINTRFPCG
ncbi:hypothetical protein B484DRAFT_477201 [Ochromonadaceae sp. CCMP2298]|nr:hypothetical protein B484DRAFT_477201 [Ochromonadaceae sp. CCMP2298]